MSDAQIVKEQLHRWQQDPVSFIRKVIGAEPTEHQIRLLNSVVQPGSHTSIRSGHNTGKSTGLSWLILWFVSLFPDCKVPCTAPTGHQLKDVLWAEIAKWHNRMHPIFKNRLEVTADKVFVKDREKTQFAVARTSRKENPEALQGFHATNLLFLIDEASGVPDNVYTVAEGALASKGSRVIMTANPTQNVGYFYNSHHKHKHLWSTLHFSCLDTPLVDPNYAKDMIEKYGEDSDIYRVRVLGEFPRASIVQLIPTDLVVAALGKHLQPMVYDFAPKILGVDVAWYGDDRSCIWLRQGLASKLLWQKRQVDSIDIAGLVAQFEDEHRTDATFVDAGMGNGVIDQLRRLGRNPTPVYFGGSSNNPKCGNKRAEMWVEVLEWLRLGGALPNDPDIQEDLTAPEYFMTLKGQVMLERKEDMKSRGLCSPDLGDGLALTFAQKVRKLDIKKQLSKEPNKVQTEYKLF